MKKFKGFLLVVCCCLVVSGCGSYDNSAKDDTAKIKTKEVADVKTSEGSKDNAVKKTIKNVVEQIGKAPQKITDFIGKAATDEIALKDRLPKDLPLELQWTVPVVEGHGVKLHIPAAKKKLSFLIIETDKNNYIAIDRKNGRAKWMVDLGMKPSTAPVFTKYSVYTIVNNYLIGIAKDKGEILWKLKLDFPSTSYFTAEEGKRDFPFFVIPAMNKIVYGYTITNSVWPPERGVGSITRKDLSIRRSNLQLMWKYSTEGLIEGRVDYKDSMAYIADSNRKTCALDCLKVKGYRPELIWKAISQGPNSSGIVVAGAYAIVASRDQNVYCYLRRTGSLAWKFESGLTFVRPVVFAACKYRKEVSVIAFAKNGTIFCLAAQSGKILWQREKSGKVVAIDVEDDRLIKKKAI